jgi:hypothetical protein
MPLLTTLAAIATIAGAGVSSGLAIDQAVTAPCAPKPAAPATPPPPTAQQQAQQRQQTEAAVGQQLPTLEGLTSGYANPGYYAQQGATAAGVAGQPGGNTAAISALEKSLGLPAGSLNPGGGGGGTSTPPFQPAGTGNANAGAFPTSPADLTEFTNSFIST